MSRRQYPFHLIEPRWQRHWGAEQTFRAFNPGDDIPESHPFAARHQLSRAVDAAQLPPKFYILDMFPYPSGTGLHVGHPEGYTATDILARYRRARGWHVLHPMGWDAFGLPAEQYAVKTGQHPRKTTAENIATFKRQIQSLGFSYDWSREVDTTDPDYFRWSQWIFLQLYNSWFNPVTNRAEPISTLKHPAHLQLPEVEVGRVTPCAPSSVATERRARSDAPYPSDLEAARREWRDNHRLAYVKEAPVWWCEELGTVLANEEVVDGRSEVGNYPVTRKPMRQWMLRITAYAEKLLADLDTIEWSGSLKEMQRNWIGRSEGAEVKFSVLSVQCSDNQSISVFTTRPDTLFGATYMVLAPEHKLVDELIGFANRTVAVNGRITANEVRVFDANGADLGVLRTEDALTLAQKKGLDLNEVNSGSSPPTCVLEDHGAFRFRQQEIAKQSDSVLKYREDVAKKSDLERTELAKEKSGVFTGAFAINPVNGEKIPIWIADYVLASYGTGAIMAVPGHDQRDFEFAVKFSLPIIPVVKPMEEWVEDHPSLFVPQGNEKFLQEGVEAFTEAFVEEGSSINSANAELSLNGLPTAEAKSKITDWLEAKGLGKRTINYKLRDWLFSRQRYWGEPFPIVWKRDANGQPYHEALPESALPLLPPELTDYKPTTTGEPPLARAKDWVNLPDGSTRETNTMPQWAGSCWYYLRYLDAKNGTAFVSREAEQYWMGGGAVTSLQGCMVASGSRAPDHVTMQPCNPCNLPATPGVDLYVGGTEHAVLHLLYARFWHKVLHDLGYVSTAEPFFKLVNQGIILGEDNQKMSKARGNVVNPDDMVREFGADALRLFEMFMGPLEMSKPWSTKGVEGVYRFLGRVWRLFVDEKAETAFEQAETTATAPDAALLDLITLDGSIADVQPTAAQLKTLHACIKKATEDLDAMRFNTAISAMMVFVNEANGWQSRPLSVMRPFLQLLAPFAPHLAEELWARLHGTFGQLAPSLSYAPWPAFDASLLVEDTIEIPVQVNGKLRDVIRVAADADIATIEAAALGAEKVKPFLDGKTVKKIIVPPRKNVVSIVVA